MSRSPGDEGGVSHACRSSRLVADVELADDAVVVARVGLAVAEHVVRRAFVFLQGDAYHVSVGEMLADAEVGACGYADEDEEEKGADAWCR